MCKMCARSVRDVCKIIHMYIKCFLNIRKITLNEFKKVRNSILEQIVKVWKRCEMCARYV